MARLLVHVEGETEETFVNEILAPHLRRYGFTRVSARLLGNARQRDRRGGIRGWDSVRGDILNFSAIASGSVQGLPCPNLRQAFAPFGLNLAARKRSMIRQTPARPGT